MIEDIKRKIESLKGKKIKLYVDIGRNKSEVYEGQVLETYKNAVKIGIKAPNNVQVFREEIYREIKKANEMSKVADIKALDSINAPKAQGFNLADKLKHKN